VLPLIVDTDPGVDDALALLLAAASPEMDLRAVTTVHGNVGLAATTANAARLLALAGRSDVPLGAGAARPLVHPAAPRGGGHHGADGLGGQASALPAGAAPDPRGAVGLMADVLRAARQPVTIAAIGPLTNIALLLAVHPELTGRIGRIVAMGGLLAAGGTAGPAEFNIGRDPEAAHRVLTQTDVPVGLVPLDLTLRCTAGPAWLDALAAAGPRCARLAAMTTHGRSAHRNRYGVDAVRVHDALAVLEAVRPATLRTEPTPLQVTCDLGPTRGTTGHAPGGPNVALAVGFGDGGAEAVLAEILRRLVRHR